MAEKLKENKEKLSVTLPDNYDKDVRKKDIDELHKMLFNIKVMEEQVAALLSKFEFK
jgi:hypothetical protein